jgi:hypothetical protein
MLTLLSLIGEQPIPNLLPIRFFKPSTVLAVHSDMTQKAAARLEKFISDQTMFWPLQVDAYDIQAIQADLLMEIRQRQLAASDLLFNLTGGTKPMSLAAYLVAAELSAPVIYLQSESRRSCIFRYEFREGIPILADDSTLPGLIIIEDYLRAYVGESTERRTQLDADGHCFEQAIAGALRPAVDELRCGISLQGVVDIDLVVRCDNQVGIIEAKLGKNGPKHAIDQLNTAGGQKYLGTYTKKFLVSDQDWGQFADLKALADARQITVIELPGSRGKPTLDTENIEKLRKTILKELGKDP